MRPSRLAGDKPLGARPKNPSRPEPAKRAWLQAAGHAAPRAGAWAIKCSQAALPTEMPTVPLPPTASEAARKQRNACAASVTAPHKRLYSRIALANTPTSLANAIQRASAANKYRAPLLARQTPKASAALKTMPDERRNAQRPCTCIAASPQAGMAKGSNREGGPVLSIRWLWAHRCFRM